jgi:hypothetical protein
MKVNEVFYIAIVPTLAMLIVLCIIEIVDRMM